VVEVETAESVNHLEAMSQWASFARLRVPFHLYVPASSVDSARRLCADLQIPADELWAYHAVGDQLRFALVQRSEAAEAAARAVAARAVASTTGNHVQSAKAGAKKGVAPASRRLTPKPPAKTPKAVKLAKPAKPAAKHPSKPNSKAVSAARRKAPTVRSAASRSSSRPIAPAAKSSKRK
jgi:hypothetical protein